MNGAQLVASIGYLLEKEQSRLLGEANKKMTSKFRESEINEEIREIEDLIEQTREGWEEL